MCASEMLPPFSYRSSDHAFERAPEGALFLAIFQKSLLWKKYLLIFIYETTNVSFHAG